MKTIIFFCLVLMQPILLKAQFPLMWCDSLKEFSYLRNEYQPFIGKKIKDAWNTTLLSEVNCYRIHDSPSDKTIRLSFSNKWGVINFSMPMEEGKTISDFEANFLEKNIVEITIFIFDRYDEERETGIYGTGCRLYLK